MFTQLHFVLARNELVRRTFSALTVLVSYQIKVKTSLFIAAFKSSSQRRSLRVCMLKKPCIKAAVLEPLKRRNWRCCESN